MGKSPKDSKDSDQKNDDDIALSGDGPVRVSDAPTGGGDPRTRHPLISTKVPKVEKIHRGEKNTEKARIKKHAGQVQNLLKSILTKPSHTQRILLASITSIMLLGVIGAGIAMLTKPHWVETTIPLWQNKNAESYGKKLHEPILRRITIRGSAGETLTEEVLIHEKPMPYEKVPQTLLDALIAIKQPKNSALSNPKSATMPVLMHEMMQDWIIDDTTAKQTPAQYQKHMDRLLETQDDDIIIAYYLSSRYMGVGLFGVEAAAINYFGKPLWAITIAESVLLMAILENPLQSPYLYPKVVEQRARGILKILGDTGKISTSVLEQARNQIPNTQWRKEQQQHTLIPMLMDEAFAVLKHQGMPAYMVLKTSMNSAMQRKVEGAINSQMGNSNARNIQEIALMLMTPTGAIQALGGQWGTKKSNGAVYTPKQLGKMLTPLFILSGLYKNVPLAQIKREIPAGIAQNANKGAQTLQSQYSNGFTTINTAMTQSLAQGLNAPYPAPIALNVRGETQETMAHLMTLYAMPITGVVRPTHPYLLTEITTPHRKLWQRTENKNIGNAIPLNLLQNLRTLLRDPKVLGIDQSITLNNIAGGVGGITPNGQVLWFMGYTQNLVMGVWVASENTMPLGIHDTSTMAKMLDTIVNP